MLFPVAKEALLVLEDTPEEEVKEEVVTEPVPVGPAGNVELPMVKRALLLELKSEEVLGDPLAVGPTVVLFPVAGKGALLLV